MPELTDDERRVFAAHPNLISLEISLWALHYLTARTAIWRRAMILRFHLQGRLMPNIPLSRLKHGNFASGDVVYVNCDRTGIDNVVALVDAVAVSAITLRNINTTNTGKFPVGG